MSRSGDSGANRRLRVRNFDRPGAFPAGLSADSDSEGSRTQSVARADRTAGEVCLLKGDTIVAFAVQRRAGKALGFSRGFTRKMTKLTRLST